MTDPKLRQEILDASMARAVMKSDEPLRVVSRVVLALIDQENQRRVARREQLALMMQTACEHPKTEIIRAPYIARSHLSDGPPFRVCRKCGYAEEGWHCGYWLLATESNDSVPELSQDEARKLVTTRIISQSELCERRFGRTK